MTEENCMSCIHMTEIAVMGPDRRELVGKTIPICRRFPPTPVFVGMQTEHGIAQSCVPQYPPVNESTWCFEYVGDPIQLADDGTDLITGDPIAEENADP